MSKSKDNLFKPLSIVVSLIMAVALVPAAAFGEVADAFDEEPLAVAALSNEDPNADPINTLVINYKDKPVEIDEAVSPEGTDDVTTLEDMGVISQNTAIEDSPTFGDTTVAVIDEGTDINEAIEKISALPEVESVEPNYNFTTLGTANDTYFESGGLKGDGQWYLKNSKATDAWDYVSGGQKVSIAVIDTGCRMDHNDLVGTINKDYAYYCDYDEGTHNLNSYLLKYASDGGDSNGHGTSVCGIASAKTNNSLGIAGTGYTNTQLIPVRVMNQNGIMKNVQIEAALDYVDKLVEEHPELNLRVVNMSIGLYQKNFPSYPLVNSGMHQRIQHLVNNHGITVVCAGGNGNSVNTPYVNEPLYPADFSECVSVTATTREQGNCLWSDYSADKDISAPGEYILTTEFSDKNGYTGGHKSDGGSSYASPIVAGIAALMYSAFPTASNDDIVKAMKNTATAITVNAHPTSGSAGLINALKMYQYLETLYSPGDGSVAMYRMYNRNTGEHFYTSNPYERDTIMKAGWRYEGVGWRAPGTGFPVYRLYNPNAGDHHYTTNSYERDMLVGVGWNYEGIGWYSGGSVPVYREYNPNKLAWNHNYTKNPSEHNMLIEAGWNNEGIGWYAVG